MEFFAEAVQGRLIEWSIKFRPVPLRSLQLNGQVKRVRPTVLEEFWAMVDPKADGAEDQLAVWVQHYN